MKNKIIILAIFICALMITYPYPVHALYLNAGIGNKTDDTLILWDVEQCWNIISGYNDDYLEYTAGAFRVASDKGGDISFRIKKSGTLRLLYTLHSSYSPTVDKFEVNGVEIRNLSVNHCDVTCDVEEGDIIHWSCVPYYKTIVVTLTSD